MRGGSGVLSGDQGKTRHYVKGGQPFIAEEKTEPKNRFVGRGWGGKREKGKNKTRRLIKLEVWDFPNGTRSPEGLYHSYSGPRLKSLAVRRKHVQWRLFLLERQSEGITEGKGWS